MSNKKQSLFPRIHRFIPELFLMIKKGTNKQKITWGIELLLVVLSLWQGTVLAKTLIAFRTVLANRQKTIAERALWIDIANKYPGYRDAYFQVAVLSYQIGDMATEQKYLQKTMLTDPNFAPAQSLEKITETDSTN